MTRAVQVPVLAALSWRAGTYRSGRRRSSEAGGAIVGRVRWLKRLGLACGAVAAALLAGEGVLRLAGRTPASFLYTGSLRDRQSGWDVTYGVDGDRRRVTAPARAGTAKRVAVLGDSFAFGQGVPDLQDFTSRLNARLDAWRLDNLGVVGAGLHEYQVVARDLVDHRYSGVLVVFYGNDVTDMPARRSFAGALAARSSVFA